MRILQILFAIIGFSTSCYSQNIENESKKVNEIINYFIEHDSTLIDEKYQIVSEFNPSIDAPPNWYVHNSIFSKLNSSFNLADSLYYYDYFSKMKDIKLNLAKSRKSYRYIEKKIIDDYISQNETDYKNGIEYDFYEEFEKRIGIVQAFGLPIVSKDGKYLLFTYVKYGPGRKYRKFTKLYEKRNSEWLYQKTLFDIEK